MRAELEHDLTDEFAAEDEAVNRVIRDLQAHNASTEEVREVLQKIHQTSTAIIETPTFRVLRDPDERWRIDWKQAA